MQRHSFTDRVLLPGEEMHLLQSSLVPSWWSLSCTYNPNPHPKAGMCQDQASSPGQEPSNSGRARAKSGAQISAGSCSATWKSQQLFDFPKYCLEFIPFWSVGILWLPPGAEAGWHCWDGTLCPAQLGCVLCVNPRPLCTKAAARPCWGWAGHGWLCRVLATGTLHCWAGSACPCCCCGNVQGEAGRGTPSSGHQS